MKRTLEMKRTNTWKPFIVLMMAVMMLGVMAVPADAAAKIKKVEYEGKGKVEVDFRGKVSYKDVKVSVKDSAGSSVSSRITKKDKDDLVFKISDYKQGEKYSFTISGVKKKSESDYGSVSGSVKIPDSNGSIPIKEIDYDSTDKEVSFEFDTKVKWKSPKVSIKKDSKNYVKSIKDKDNNDIEVKVKKLKKGETYKYKISGIKKKGDSSYTTISGTFTP